MQPDKDYEALHAKYLSSGLTQSLVHMLQRFSKSIVASEWQLQPQALREVVLRLHLNELELALTYFYYDKTHGRVRVYNREQLLLLCSYHAKHYLNSKFRLYEKAIEQAFPGFCPVYREFANLHCRQNAVDPMSLNSCFLHLRRAPIDPSYMVFDLNHQADLLFANEDVADSPYKVLRKWKAAPPVVVSQTSPPQQELPTVIEEPSVELYTEEVPLTDAVRDPQTLSLGRDVSFFSQLELIRGPSQLPQDPSRPS